jgi:hypothetical protein
MNQIKTWQQRQAETGIGSVEAKDDEIRELRQAIEQADKVEPVAIPDDVRTVAKAMQKDGYRGPLAWATKVIDFVADYTHPPTAPAQPDMTHCANEWADATMSALDGLRNVRDGVSTPDQVIAIIEANIEHCRGVTAPVQQPLTDEQIHKLAASLMYTKLDYNLAFARAIEAHIKGASL